MHACAPYFLLSNYSPNSAAPCGSLPVFFFFVNKPAGIDCYVPLFQKPTQYKHPWHHHFDMYKTGHHLLSIIPYIAAKYFFLANNAIIQLAKYYKLPTNSFGLLHRSSLSAPMRPCHACEASLFFSPTTSCPGKILIPSEPH